MQDLLNDILEYIKTRLEKSIFILLLLILSIYFIFFLTSIFVMNGQDSIVDNILKKMDILSRQEPLLKTLDEKDYAEDIKKQNTYSFYKDIISRDIFAQYVVKPEDKEIHNPYTLVEIVKKECPYIWKGIIKESSGERVFAQLNDGKKTIFVKPGDELGEYNVVNVSELAVELKRKDNKKIVILEMNKIAKEDEEKVKILNKKDNKTYLVGLDDVFEGWKVSFIGQEHIRVIKDRAILYVKK